MTITIGVDPGASGAIAFLDATGDLLGVRDMPEHGGIVSAPALADHVDRFVILRTATAWIESVHSMPKQGVASSFKFGDAFGTVKGVLGALRIPANYVTPAKWKRAMGLSSDKGASRRRAIELWPQHSALFARVKDDGRAEAALIALYGQQQVQGR